MDMSSLPLRDDAKDARWFDVKFADEKLEFANDLIKIEYSLRSEI